MAIWYTSDLHVAHARVSEDRGFTTTAEHDAALAENWDRVVRADDVVWVLGDLALNGKPHVPRALAWIAARPGVKHLVSGNHDETFPGRSRAHIWQAVYLTEAFASVQSAATHRIGGHRVLLSHFPYAGSADGDHEGMEDRFEEWRLPDRGQWLLHGHTHNRDQRVHGRMIHVGLDAHGLTPVPQRWIEETIGDA